MVPVEKQSTLPLARVRMKAKLENFFCIVVVVLAICSMIAMFLLTHPTLFSAIANEVHKYSVVGFSNGGTLSKGGNVLAVTNSHQNFN